MNKLKIGFLKEDLNEAIWLPPRPKTKQRYKSSWFINTEKLSVNDFCIQIDNQYIFSNNFHVHNNGILLSKNTELTWTQATTITHYLSFLFDTPIVLKLGKSSNINYDKHLKKIASLKGFHTKNWSLKDQIEAQSDEIASQIANSILNDNFIRETSHLSFFGKGTCSLRTQSDQMLNNALYAYQEALMSSSASTQIFNFWKAIEACTNKRIREENFENFKEHKHLKVITKHIIREKENAFDYIARLKSHSVTHLDVIKKIEKNGSACQYYWALRRNPIAHADKDVFKVGISAKFSFLLNDAILLKIIARTFIEMKWLEIVQRGN